MDFNLENLERRIIDLENKEKKNVVIELEKKRKRHDVLNNYFFGGGMGGMAAIPTFATIYFLGTTVNGLILSILICALYGMLIVKGA